ncbi:MAG: twin-arginine translocation signal domain-containing protein [Parashewanella sp.]
MRRRTFILGSMAATAGLALGGASYLESLKQIPQQSSRPYDILLHLLLPIFLDGALPNAVEPKQHAINRTIDNIYQTLDILPRETSEKLHQLLSMLDSRLGLLLLTGSITPLLRRTPAALITQVEQWRFHYLAMMNEAYLGLREVIMSSYYASPEHWQHLGYSKPAQP